MLEVTRQSARQRSDLTFKYNKSLGRHGWLRLTPAYSVKLVKEVIARFPADAAILDPFSGTATTTLTAAERGNSALSFDINPFLIWLGNVKCRSYSVEHLACIQDDARLAIGRVPSLIKNDNWVPPLFNIERWWSAGTLQVLAALGQGLSKCSGSPQRIEQTVWRGSPSVDW